MDSGKYSFNIEKTKELYDIDDSRDVLWKSLSIIAAFLAAVLLFVFRNALSKQFLFVLWGVLLLYGIFSSFVFIPPFANLGFAFVFFIITILIAFYLINRKKVFLKEREGYYAIEI